MWNSLYFSIASSTFKKEGFSIGDEHRMAMWNVNVESEPAQPATAWLKIVWFNQQSTVPVQSAKNTFLQ